ncbi:MAG TPA: phosphoribosyltransferase family protein [Candidatus Saccharimonadales bacterium]
MLEQIISMITPYECLSCGNEGPLLCTACQKHLPCAADAGAPKDAFAATVYEGHAEQLVHALKFERAKAAADVIAQVMNERLPDCNIDLVAYVPTASTRVRMRGYDQAAVLARRLARMRRVPFAPLLARVGQQRQVGQRRAARLRQLQEAYRPLRVGLLQHKRVMLVDDVITTGATLHAAAEVLRQAGADAVLCAAFAAAPKRP